MVEPMSTKEIERLMSNFRPTPELDKVFARGLEDGYIDIGDIPRLEKAGYVAKKEDAGGEKAEGGDDRHHVCWSFRSIIEREYARDSHKRTS